jgi:hypothetical protein
MLNRIAALPSPAASLVLAGVALPAFFIAGAAGLVVVSALLVALAQQTLP